MRNNAVGFIMIPRKIFNTPLWSNVSKEPYDTRLAFLDMVAQAYFTDAPYDWNGKTVMIKRGQFPTTRKELARLWGWKDVKKVDRLLSTLERAGMVTHTGTPDGRVITIENYDDFQGDEDTQKDNQRPTQRDNQRPNQWDTNNNNYNNSNKENNYSYASPKRKELIPPDDWNG